ncbi:hypothetical protein [Eikenella sp. HMSC061C02]|uniref:hypothetical protein n=1 Tax=Eikenella sp. HMSC061C02 TaxID=1715021 RepID=UPI0008A10B1F|nr:hypothetical protein [Eikenella sp. HMSC061C02]OFN62603.1 hypothetical protein HMPREF2541_05080 [Eikenella sp. HMSC061C02]
MKITYNPPRPSVNYEIKLQAAFEFLQAHPDIEPERVNQHSIEHMADDIAMHSTISSDGYELAKELDTRAGWENIDMDLVETLDSYSMYLHHRLEREKKQWAAENNIQPPYPVGSRVRSLLQWNNITGTITGISQHHAACYEVKKDGTEPDDTTRRIIEFEAVELLEGETK